MNASTEQLRSRFVTVQLSLLSIAVALILENLLNSMLDLEAMSLLTAAQAFDVTVAAISMWIGFAYGISTVSKPPHLLDFLVPFLLLFSLSSAVYFITSGELALFFFAGAAGSASAAAALWLDVRMARQADFQGPSTTAAMLTVVAALEVTVGLIFANTELPWTWAPLLMLPGITLQATTAFRSMRFWRNDLVAQATVSSE